MDSLQKDYDTAKSIGEQFLNAFFNKGPIDYSIYYGNDSVLTFESDVYFGASNITAKLQSLNVITTFTHCDIQPGVTGILLLISGAICLQGETNHLPFMRVMYLAQKNGSYYIKNDVYKITFG